MMVPSFLQGIGRSRQLYIHATVRPVSKCLVFSIGIITAFNFLHSDGSLRGVHGELQKLARSGGFDALIPSPECATSSLFVHCREPQLALEMLREATSFGEQITRGCGLAGSSNVLRKNRLAAAASRLAVSRKSMVWPAESTARYRYRSRPLIRM